MVKLAAYDTRTGDSSVHRRHLSGTGPRRTPNGRPDDDGPPVSRRAVVAQQWIAVDQVVACGDIDDEPVLSPSSLIATSRCFET
jgi:hypothetical protein